MKILNTVAVSCFTLVAFFVSSGAAFSATTPLDEKFTLRFGPFLAKLDATVKSLGRDWDFDESFNTGDFNLSAYGLWRITPRLRLEAGYSGIDKSSSETLLFDVNTALINLPAGSSIYDSFETDVVKLAVGYAFMRGESYEFGADLGVNFTSLKESARVTIPRDGIADLYSIDVDQPLPTIGLFYNVVLSDSWYFTSRAGVFSLNVGDIDGTIWDVIGSIEYRPWEHVGLGLSFSYTSADVTVDSKRTSTDTDYDYYGPSLYMVVGF